VKAKWFTLLFVSSLGLMAWLCRSNGAAAVAGDGEPAISELASADARRHALDLLRQAATELQANHLDLARQLAKQAIDLNATYSLFDVRPEHVLAEIERKERDSGVYAKTPRPASDHQVVQTPRPVSVPVAAAADSSDPFAQPTTAESSKAGEVFKALDPAKISDASRFPSPLVPISQAAVEQAAPVSRPASPPPIDQTKARAIAILDRGLQALDEQRFDDAERYARAALSLHASFSKLEYKPEYLITEVGIARARQRLDAATSQTTVQSAGPTQPKAPVAPADRSFQRPAPAAPSTAAAPAPPVAHPYATAQSAAIPTGATSSHERAERLLQEALADLHAGRDDVARARIEGALGVIHSGTSQPPARFPGSLAAATPPVAMTPGAMLPAPPRTDPPQAPMPRAGFLNYAPDSALNAHDAALKPLHDPYLGDDPTTTQKSTAGENSLRETLPTDVPLSPALSLNRPLPRMSDELPAPTTTASKANYATPAGVSQTQAVTAGQNPAARVRWPESDPAASATAPAPAASTIPGATPAPSDTPSPSARYSYAPVTSSSWANSNSADDHPGFFHRVWSAITGE
jgi:hypothetical protein